MMKRMCCLVAVLALTGSASAVNIVWNRGAETSYDFSMPTGSFSVALLVNVVSLSGTADTTMVTFSNFYANSKSSPSQILAYGESKGLGVHWGTKWTPDSSSSTSGEHTVVLTFDKQESGGYTIRAYIDAFSDRDETLTPTSDTMTITFTENTTLWTYQGFAIYDDVLTTDEMNTLQTTRDVESIVPEPSFLALLALGAGALVLRRKTKCA